MSEQRTIKEIIEDWKCAEGTETRGKGGSTYYKIPDRGARLPLLANLVQTLLDSGYEKRNLLNDGTVALVAEACTMPTALAKQLGFSISALTGKRAAVANDWNIAVRKLCPGDVSKARYETQETVNSAPESSPSSNDIPVSKPQVQPEYVRHGKEIDPSIFKNIPRSQDVDDLEFLQDLGIVPAGTENER